jgi:D-alanine-D-alanine ligase
MSHSRRLNVAVVEGGPSSEAEVSRASAAGVARALVKSGHRVVRHELDGSLPESLRTGGFDVVFPVVHGAVGEDGCLQGLLEVLGLPYVGSRVLASALAMNKVCARVLFAHAGLPIADGRSYGKGGSARDAAEAARRELGARLVVKPASHGSAIGVSRIEAEAPIEAVAEAIESAWALDDVALVEHFARGREVTCGVLELEGCEALPPTEIDAPSDPFYNFEARYTPGRSVHTCPARLPLAVAEAVQTVAVAAHKALGCRDLSRVDFVVGDDDSSARVTLLEVNTLPGMTPTSLFPEAAERRGIPMWELCDAMVLRAHARGSAPRMPSQSLSRVSESRRP